MQHYPEKKPRTIKCKCGLEIALSPNLKEMGYLIEAHALAHGLQEKNPDKAEVECNRIEDYLIAQVMKVISTEDIKGTQVRQSPST